MLDSPFPLPFCSFFFALLANQVSGQAVLSAGGLVLLGAVGVAFVIQFCG
jgi:hypothetical protein